MVPIVALRIGQHLNAGMLGSAKHARQLRQVSSFVLAHLILLDITCPLLCRILFEHKLLDLKVFVDFPPGLIRDLCSFFYSHIGLIF